MNRLIPLLNFPTVCTICAPFVHHFYCNGAQPNTMKINSFFQLVHRVHHFLACVREYNSFSPLPYHYRFPRFRATGANIDFQKIYSREKNSEKWCTWCTHLFNTLILNVKILCMIFQKWCTHHAHYAHTQFNEWK